MELSTTLSIGKLLSRNLKGLIMFDFFKRNRQPTFYVTPVATGKWAIYNDTEDQVVATYTRKRDAFRGAERMGLTVEGIRD